MPPSSRLSGYVLGFLVLGALVADQVSKYAVEKFTPAGTIRAVIPGLLNLVHTTNSGVAFGLFANSERPWIPALLIVFSLIVIAILGWLLATGQAGGKLGQCGLALILGGAAGNILDRLLRHSVTDFIDFYVGSHHWYTFNIADSAIVAGAGLVLLELLRSKEHANQERA
jgi:signal peptidase II